MDKIENIKTEDQLEPKKSLSSEFNTHLDIQNEEDDSSQPETQIGASKDENSSKATNVQKKKVVKKVLKKVVKKESEGTVNVDEILLNSIGKAPTSPKHLDNQTEEIVIPNEELKPQVKGQSNSHLEVLIQDPYLKPWEGAIRERLNKFNGILSDIEKNEGSFFNFVKGYNKMGLNLTEDGIIYREYAPGAKGLTLFGDFNKWNRDEYKCEKDSFGVWSILLKNDSEGNSPIEHGTKIKVNITLPNGKREDRNPVWSRYLIQSPESYLFDSVFWWPPHHYKFQYPTVPRPKSMWIYEAHVGMSSIEPKVSTYKEFTQNMLPRIKDAGYTAIQLMAIMEHAYYGSFGYHVTNFFAISSRSGTPDDLKELIDEAHKLGLFVILDIVHSHASSNVLDGINNFDGTDYLYFHSGAKGFHKLWDSRLFNYQDWETLRFLLSNISWYQEEYHFDGFRFDGITSILYKNHGINYSFSGNYAEYFGGNFDVDGGVYLMLANHLVHTLNPDAVTIAEDVSGMPTLCRPISEGGFGFDYRLNMSMPDKWIKLLKEVPDENWNMGDICHTLINRRYGEKHISYVESHDQCIVGDKTIAQWLFDQEIYNGMSVLKSETVVVDRGMRLHKMIRLITSVLGGEGYLSFMGNEFGHPEWVDFPREGNNFSYTYCRRKWDLCDSKEHRFQFLLNFDREMHKLEKILPWFEAGHQYITLKHEQDKLIVFEKGDLLFIFNFHPSKSFEHYRIGTTWASDHIILFDTDELQFGGKERLKYGHQNYFPFMKERWMNRDNYIQLYIPSRTAIVLIAKQNMDKYNLSDYLQNKEETVKTLEK